MMTALHIIQAGHRISCDLLVARSISNTDFGAKQRLENSSPVMELSEDR